MTKVQLVIILLFTWAKLLAQGHDPYKGPIIDMHLHPWPHEDIRIDSDSAATLKLNEMEKNNVVLAVGSGPYDYLDQWKKKIKEKLLIGPLFPCVHGKAPNGGPSCFSDGSD